MLSKDELFKIVEVCDMAQKGFDALKCYGVNIPDEAIIELKSLRIRCLKLGKELQKAEEDAKAGKAPEPKKE